MEELAETPAEVAPSDSARLNDLKKFTSAGRGYLSQVSDADWNDWHWQLKNRVTNLEQLERLLPTLTPEERARFGRAHV